MSIERLRKAEQLYKKISMPLEQVVFPLILLLWPLIKVDQGIDVTDSTYSLSNYLFADRLDGVWLMSTYMSNLLGSLLVRLPYGNTLIGINVYTGLILSATALICYYGLRKEFTAPVMFIGEFMAVSFCWIPTGILYNYLTYLLFNASAVIIYYAVKTRKSLLFYMAGLVLGLNSFVRIPNVAETGLIIVVWIGMVSTLKQDGGHRWEKGNELIGMTGACIVGYIIGMAIPVALIAALYGGGSLTKMMTGLEAMSQSNEEYTPVSMVLSIVRAYLRTFRWMAVIVAVIFAGTLMIAVLKRNPILKWLGRVIYIAVMVLMLRFFWGRGMYSFRFYEDYTSMYEWGMIVLILAWICAVSVFVREGYNPLVKTMASIALMMLIITPLGSNNYTMQNINNMFLVMPFVLYVTGGWMYRGTHRLRLENVLYGCNFPWMSMVIVVLAFTFCQTFMFHKEFVFRDGMDGTPRDTTVSTVYEADAVKGVYTGEYNARTLAELCRFMDEDTTIEAVIYWGDCPGLAYILRKPMAIGTTWPNLASYTVEDFETGLQDAAFVMDKGSNAVIKRKSYVAENESAVVKEDILNSYIDSNHMISVFENEEYIVYR